MNFVKENILFKRNSNIVALKYTIVTFTVFSVGFLLLKFPAYTFSGVKEGLNISVQLLIPSLFPFLVFSCFVVNTQICTYLLKPFKKLAKIFFSLPEQVLTVLILSVVGGYPIGPEMIKGLYEKGDISQLQGKRMLLFCVNPSPAFVISTVGYAYLKSETIGAVVFLSVILASVFVGLLQRFLNSDEYSLSCTIKNQNHSTDFSHILIDSVRNAVGSMVMICAWVILFSGFIKIIDATVYSSAVKVFLYAACEVTAGCRALSGKVSTPAIAGILAFGGFCTHLQIMPCINKLKLKYKYFFTSRILTSALSTVLCKVLLDIVPESIQTVSIGNKPVNYSSGISFSIAVSVIIMSLLILIGDNYIFNIKNSDNN